MKFIFFLLLLLQQAPPLAAQTKAKINSAPVNTSFGQSSIFSLESLKTQFKINYFSETVGPSIKKWDDNEVYYNDSTQTYSKSRTPMTMYHSFNVRYLYSDQLNIFMSPRFSTVFGDRNDLKSTQEQRNIYSDDWQFGIFYTLIKNKNFQYNNRLTHRAPISKNSQDENIISQVEWQHDLTYAFTPSLRGILWNNYRYYVYNENSTIERYRINFTGLLNYTLNDTWNVQFMNDFDLQHRGDKDVNSPKHRKFFNMKRNRNYMSFGVGYTPIRNLTFIPYVRILDERNIRNETTTLGLWILGKLI